MSDKRTRRGAPAVNAGSMADIAFLLLIFFLVTTTIAEDKGILVNLPEWSDDIIDTPIPEDRVLTVHINKFDRLLVENEEVALTRVQGLLENHLRKPGARPGTRIVSLQHDRETSYERYLAVYDALKAGYHTLWDEVAMDNYGVQYDFLTKTEQAAVRKLVLMVISEAEPTEV